MRLRRAAQSALACVIALALALIYRLPHGYWALVTIIVLTQANVGASISKALLRLGGTLLGAACGVALLLLVQDPLPFVILLSTLVVVSSYFGSGRVAPYAFAIFGITTIIVAMSGFLDPTLGVSIAVQRSAEVGLGIVVALFVTMVVWPIRAADELPRQLAATVHASAALFTAVTDALCGDRAPGTNLQRTEAALSRSFSSHFALLEQAATESRAYQARHEQWTRLILFLETTFNDVSALKAACDAPSATHPQDAFHHELTVLVTQIAAAFAAIERAIRDAGTCADPTAALDAAYAGLEARYETLRRTDGFREYAITAMARFDSIVLALRELSRTLARVSTAVTAIVAAPQSSPAPSATPVASTRRLPRIDPRRLRYGIKVALSVLIAFLGWLVLQWPFGASAVLTAFVVTQGSLGSSNRKAMLRLVGALVGGFGLAIPAIIFVVPYIDTVYSFSVLIFVVMFLCAYVITGSERISYLGLQAAIAFCLTLVPDAKQDVSMNPAFTRAVAVFLGSVVGVCVVRFVWPAHASRELRQTLAAALRDCGAAFHAITQHAVAGAETSQGVAQRRATLKEGLERCLPLLSESTMEANDPVLHAGRGLRLIEAVEVVALRLGAVDTALGNRLDPELRGLIAADLCQVDAALGTAVESLAANVEEGNGRADLKGVDTAATALQQRLAMMRASHSLQRFPAVQVVTLLAFVERCTELGQAVLGVGSALASELVIPDLS